MKDEDLDLDSYAVPELDPSFAARVLRLARAELLSTEDTTASLTDRWKGSVRRAVVPVLLFSAGGCRTALTIQEIPSAYEPKSK